MSQFERPSGAYAGAAGLANRTKYQDEAAVIPKQPISSAKIDGELNYLIDGLNSVDAAKGSRNSIAERLDVNINADGTFKASVVAGLNDWTLHGVTVTRVNDYTVTLAGGDYRALYPVHRRVRVVVGTSPFYGDVGYVGFAGGVTTVEFADIADASGAQSVIASNPASIAYGPMVPGVTGNTPLRADKMIVGKYVLEAQSTSLKIAPVAGGLGVLIGAGGLLGVATGAVGLGTLANEVMQRLVPVGTVLPFAGGTAPTGYLLCAGQAVSRSTYAELFTALGTVYGAGDGSTTFNIPDLRGRGVAGKDDMNGTAANRVTNAISGIASTTLGASGGSQSMQQHTHTVTDPGHSHAISTNTSGGTTFHYGASGGPALVTVNTQSATTGITLQNTGVGTSQNMPPVMVLNWMIRA